MSDFLFGVLCGASFMLPGWLIGYGVAMKQGWQREDELRQRLDELVGKFYTLARGAR